MNPTKTIARMTSDIPPKKKRSVRRATGVVGRLTAIARLRSPCSARRSRVGRSCPRGCRAQGRVAAIGSALGVVSPQLERAKDLVQLRFHVGALGTTHR